MPYAGLQGSQPILSTSPWIEKNTHTHPRVYIYQSSTGWDGEIKPPRELYKCQVKGKSWRKIATEF